MKKFIKSFIFVLCVYLLGSFIYADFNIVNWSIIGRVIVAFTMFIGVIGLTSW